MPRNIADELRAAIMASGKSANEIAKACGVPQTTLSRFLRGEDMSIERGAKVAAYLGMSLMHKPAPRRNPQ